MERLRGMGRDGEMGGQAKMGSVGGNEMEKGGKTGITSKPKEEKDQRD